MGWRGRIGAIARFGRDNPTGSGGTHVTDVCVEADAGLSIHASVIHDSQTSADRRREGGGTLACAAAQCESENCAA
jgi:hypothetical protein